MITFQYLIFATVGLVLSINLQKIDISNMLDNSIQPNGRENMYQIENKLQSQGEKVEIKIYYECLCPDCRNFDSTQLAPTVEKLGQYLDLYMYPYGNAQTIERNGEYKFKCQHGPKECYGNKLHACAIDLLQNITKAVVFNSCMMDSSQRDRGSNDDAADKCGQSLYIDSTPIKECAKGPRGTTLLKYYGDESKKADFKYVPYILIGGVLNAGNNFMKDVCAAFTQPPPPCMQ